MKPATFFLPLQRFCAEIGEIKHFEGMNFLSKLWNSIVASFKNTPLFVLVILAIALLAPSLLGYMLYAILGLVLLAVISFGVLAWRMSRVQRDVMNQFRRQRENAGHQQYNNFRSSHRGTANEGDVSVHATTPRPEKRISDDVGEYVDFKEEKTNDK